MVILGVARSAAKRRVVRERNPLLLDVPEPSPIFPIRWSPDEVIVDAALMGRLHATEMDRVERAWLVAQLTERGLTNDVIAEKLHCSKRTIQLVRAEAVCVLATDKLVLQRKLDEALKPKPNPFEFQCSLLRSELERERDARRRAVEQLAEAKRCSLPMIVGVPVPYSQPRKKPLPAGQVPLFNLTS